MWIAIHQSNERYGSDRSFQSIIDLMEAQWGEGTVVGPLGGGDLVDGREHWRLPKVYRSMFSVRGIASFLGGVASAACRLGMHRLRGGKVVLVNTLALAPIPFIARALGFRVVLFVREILDDQQGGAAAILRLSVNPAHLVICNSHATRRWVESTIGKRTQLRVVHNGVVAPNPANIQSSARESGSIVYVGRLSRNKGVDTLIEALPSIRARCPDARLTIVGGAAPGGEHYVESLHARISALGLASLVDFRGYMDDASPLFQRADVAVVPSRFSEPFGRTAVEAMLAGAPVVASNVGGLPEIIEHGVSGLLYPRDDVDALARQIVTLLTDRNANARIRDAGLRRAHLRFTEQRMKRRFGSYLRRLLAPSRVGVQQLIST